MGQFSDPRLKKMPPVRCPTEARCFYCGHVTDMQGVNRDLEGGCTYCIPSAQMVWYNRSDLRLN